MPQINFVYTPKDLTKIRGYNLVGKFVENVANVPHRFVLTGFIGSP